MLRPLAGMWTVPMGGASAGAWGLLSVSRPREEGKRPGDG